MKPISRACVLAFAAGFAAGAAVADVPSLISYQGKLVNANGTPVTNATRLRFRIYRGGDATRYPSTGALLYNETAMVTPEPDGVFSRMIGAGTPGGGCPEDPCALTAEDFGNASATSWIEAMADPDGTLGTADDDVLLPRTQVGTVAYAFHAASIDGAIGGEVAGDLSVSGSITTPSTAISSGGITTSGTITAAGDISAAGRLQAADISSQGDIALTARHGLQWPTSYTRCASFPGLWGDCPSFGGRVEANLGFTVVTPVFPNTNVSQDGVDGQTDNVLMWGYNFSPLNGGRLNFAEAKFVQQIESSFYDGTQQLIEYNWDYQNAAGIQWRPLYFRIRTAPEGGPGPTLDTGSLQIRMCADCENLDLTSSGNVNIGSFNAANDSSRLAVRSEIGSLPSPSSSRFGASHNLVLTPAGGASADLLAGTSDRAAWNRGPRSR